MTDYRLLSLLIPASASGLGFFCFAVLAFSFTELAALPEAFRTGLVLVGSFALAFGAEVGTLANVVEIYRKGERLGRWDKLALAVSVLATFGAFVLAFASLLGVKATWGATVQLWGPIFLGLLAALDSYGGFMELGLYLNRRAVEQRRAIAAALEFELWRAQTIAQHQAQLRAIAGADDTATAQLAAQLRETNAALDAADAQVRQLQAQQAELQVMQVKQQDALPDYASMDTIEAIKAFYSLHPKAPQAQAAQAAGVSRARVGQLLQALEQEGAIKRNGNGVEVL